MKTIKKSFVFPEEISNWMEAKSTKACNQTDLVMLALTLLMQVDYETAKREAKRIGVTEGKILDIALHHFLKNDKKKQFQLTAEYYDETLTEEDFEID